MATSFPTNIDSLANPTSSDSLNSPSHSDQHINSNDAIEAIQAKVGADSSAVTTSHDYKIAQLEAASHDPVTVTDSSEIDFTLTDQDITASLKSGSIDETKLDTSVNASLDLADSAVQPTSTDTLTNKTLTNPVISQVNDSNGNEALKLTGTTSAVNEITVKNEATGNAPEVQATGGDTNIDLKLTPKGTGIVKGELHTMQVVLVASDTDVDTGTTLQGDFRIPGNKAITIKSVGAYVDTAAATGSDVLTIDINEGGTSILSTKITLDVGEKTSTTATTAPAISDASIAADAILTFDIDQVNETTPAKGLKVWIEYIYN